MIPLSYFVTMGVVNKVENFICDHRQHVGRPTNVGIMSEYLQG